MTHGTFETMDGKPALHFERRFAHPVDRVWQAVTDPEELKHWFPAEVEYEPRVGGRMTFRFPGDAIDGGDGEVLEHDPPRRFVFRWGDDEIRFDLQPADGGCVLSFTHVFDERDKASRDAAGWHVCLDELAKQVAGERAEAPGMEETAEHRRLYEEYMNRGMPSGAPMPTGDR